MSSTCIFLNQKSSLYNNKYISRFEMMFFILCHQDLIVNEKGSKKFINLNSTTLYTIWSMCDRKKQSFRQVLFTPMKSSHIHHFQLGLFTITTFANQVENGISLMKSTSKNRSVSSTTTFFLSLIKFQDF